MTTMGEVEVNKHCIRMSIVALGAAALGLISVAGPAQALADSGHVTASPTATVTVPGVTSASVTTSVTLPAVAPNDSTWD
jgi:hypothetical protein